MAIFCPPEMRLKVAEYIFQQINREPYCSFGGLVQHRLNLHINGAYARLLQAGGQNITNAMQDSYGKLPIHEGRMTHQPEELGGGVM